MRICSFRSCSVVTQQVGPGFSSNLSLCEMCVFQEAEWKNAGAPVSSHCLKERWANNGPRARSSPLFFLIQPAEDWYGIKI